MRSWIGLLALGLLVGCAAGPDAPVPVNPAPFDGAIRIPVGDETLDGTLYAAEGLEPHPTLVWPHQPTDATIEALRSAGLNVLYFHHRADARDDVRAAIAYLRKPEIARFYRVDVNRIVPVGDSLTECR